MLQALREANGEISSWGIVDKAKVCCLSASISELRANGYEINCRCEVMEDGTRIYWYTLVKEPRRNAA